MTAKILGIAYLSHSAFFVTVDVMELHNMIRFFLIGFYAILTLCILYEARKSLRVLKINEDFAADNVILEIF